jgi:hypothetical protein
MVAMLSFSLAFNFALLDLIALVGGQVHTLQSGAAPVALAVVVDEGVIKSVCKLEEVPPKARRIDVTGRHIVPGYIDALAYHDSEHDRLYTLAGIVAICDHGNDLARVLSARDPLIRSASMGPEIVTAGALLDGSPPATNAAVVLESVEDAHEAVEHLGELEVQFFATHARIEPEVWRALLAEARKTSARVFGPRPAKLDLAAVLAEKPAGLVALDALLPAGKGWNDVAVEDFPALAKQVAESGVWVIPTLSAISKDLDALDPKSADLEYLGPNYTSFWTNELAQRLGARDESRRRAQESALIKARALFAALRAAGAKLAPGSGAPHPWLLPGEGLHRELAQWAAAGATPAECLAACTRQVAECFDIADAGTIEAGKAANLVVLRSDPRSSVAALRDIEALVRRGTYLDSARLDEVRGELRQWVQGAKEQFEKPIDVGAPALPEGKLLLSGHTETLSAAGRLAAERWAVVREVDDTLTFCGQRRAPGGVGQPEILINVRQRVRKNRFDSFEVRAKAQGRELVVKGLRAGEGWRVERRLDGGFIDLQAAREDIAAIDCDSVTTPMLLAMTRAAGGFPVMRFHEGLELEVVRWDLAINDAGDHGFRTPTGLKMCAFDVSGAVRVLVEKLGAGQAQTTLLEFDTHGGTGLDLPKETADKLRATAASEAERKDGR